MSDQDTTIARCPTCGSPISLGTTNSGACAYCGTVVEQRPGVSQSVPSVIWRPDSAPRAARRGRRGGARGCVVGIILGTVLFVGFILAATTLSLRQVRSTLGLGYAGWPLFRSERISDLVGVVPRDAAGDDMLVLLDSGGAISLGLIDSTGRTLRWQTAPLSKEARQSVVALGADMVYLADQTRLQGLRLVDGTPAWQATLDVELPSGCDDCLLVLDKRVVALRKDRTLQAFDAQTGQPMWNTRLDDMPRQVPVVGHQLVVLEKSEAQEHPHIVLIDVADGKFARRIDPSCTRGEPNNQTASLTPSSPLLPSPDGAALFAVLRWSDTCVQRWDADADAPAWQVWLDNDLLPSSWDAHNLLLTDQRMFIANDRALSVLDTATGALTTLVRDKEYQLTPLFARDNIIVVKATPEWDRNRHSLWALDAATGERRWQYAVQAKEWFGDSGFNEWGAQLTPSGVAVVQVPGDSHELIVERLDLQTGASVGRQAIALSGTGSTTVWENRWTDRMAWLEVNTSLYTVDLVSGEIVSQER